MNETIQTVPIFQLQNSFTFKVRTILFFLVMSSAFFCKGESQNDDSTKAIGALLGGNDPSIFSESPVLNDLTVNTFITNGNQRVFQIGFSFKNNPKSSVSSKAYIGHPEVMKLSADGISVKGYMKENLSPDPLSPDRFTFILPSQTLSYKIIVIAVNPFGKTSKEIITSVSVPIAIPNPGSTPNPNNPIPPECDGAIAAPATIGNCAQHCVQVTTIGTVFEFQAKGTTVSVNDYFYIDVGISRPSGVGIAYNFLELGLDLENSQGTTSVLVPAGTYFSPKITYDFLNYDTACVEVNSYRALDAGAGNFSDSFVSKKILLP
ncbi:hypothetical protein DLM78_15320 [Leptospira stimsonii]|uniref:Uncharacterized protein n=2 Tax=Leptospira stimsonii TaxID=2202203 RepID=A0A8B3CMD8_9LEPT|nr:hypothetical protein DLM78_15320 [Leptospira stimsonii]